MSLKPARIAALLLGLIIPAAGAGCLRLDSITQLADGDGGASRAGTRPTDREDAGVVRRDAGDADAMTASLDAATPGHDAAPHPPQPGSRVGDACIDRGTYKIDGIRFRGLAQTCEGDLACVDGTCQMLDKCTPGVTHECLFSLPSTKGNLAVQVDGEYLYWLEEGTYDQLKNHRHDGALARVAVGEWKREDLASGLELAELTSTAILYARDGHLFFATRAHDYYYHVGSQQPPVQIARDLEANLNVDFPLYCFKADMIYWVDGSGIYRAQAEQSAAEQIGTAVLSLPNVACAVADDYLAISEAAMQRLDLAAGGMAEKLTDDGWGQLIGTDHNHALVTHAGKAPFQQWVRSVDLASVAPASFSNVAGGTSSAANFGVGGGFVYWTRRGSSSSDSGYSRGDNLVLRGRVDGTGTQQVVAEMLDAPAAVYYGSRGVFWTTSASTLHYAPLPQ